MKIDEFFSVLRSGEWLRGTGSYSDIVISSRMRLARNIKGFPFSAKISQPQKKEIISKVDSSLNQAKFSKPLFLFLMDDLNDLDRQFLMERHLVSLEHTQDPQGKAIFISKDETISILVNEEDHLRIQVIKSGFDLPLVWDVVNNIDEKMSSALDYCFSPDIGYLTSCPTNVGTGLRASVMVHLPGLIMTKRINRILELIAKLSFTARGLFGEGTQALGNFFQISNQVTLGSSELEIIENLTSIIKQLRSQEEEARADLLLKHKLNLENKIWRSFGILQNARIIDSAETLQHLSLLRLGVDLGIIKGISYDMLNALFIITQPAHLQKLHGKVLSVQMRDALRASILREKLVIT